MLSFAQGQALGTCGGVSGSHPFFCLFEFVVFFRFLFQLLEAP